VLLKLSHPQPRTKEGNNFLPKMGGQKDEKVKPFGRVGMGKKTTVKKWGWGKKEKRRAGKIGGGAKRTA
jgi:hypothetical protein